MPNLLISGPAGANKSGAARELLASASVPTIMIEYQELYASVLGLRRNPETGRYPARRSQDAYALPMAEYLRQAAISGALAQELDIVLTNSDGDADRRAFLLGRLGPGATEQVINPGIEVVTQRLSVDGTLSDQCREAISRWYGRLS